MLDFAVNNAQDGSWDVSLQTPRMAVVSGGVRTAGCFHTWRILSGTHLGAEALRGKGLGWVGMGKVQERRKNQASLDQAAFELPWKQDRVERTRTQRKTYSGDKPRTLRWGCLGLAEQPPGSAGHSQHGSR